MKQTITAFLLLSIIIFSSCQKSAVAPDTNSIQSSPKTIIASTTSNQSANVASNDTSLNNVVGYLRLGLAKDSINTDNILISFKPTAKTTFNSSEDAPTFQGFGLVSLSSLSSNNIPLAINALPLTNKGLSIGLKVNTQTDGIYKLNMLTIKSIPQAYQIWLMDSYRKDSLDFRQNSSYAFNIYKADTGSFGSHRFKLVLRVR
ncbi:MAG: hypothetical protein JWP37_3740 [Mucilaginibacter sp.]|nr:hypothetical protein [Mucilaginibacter sp.]